MSRVAVYSPGSTQATAVKAAREVVQKLAELLADYEEMLLEVAVDEEEAEEEGIDLMDGKDELMRLGTHAVAHSILLKHLVKWLG